MNVSADQVRAATRIAASVITADRVPPLRLDESRGHGPARRARFGWAVPLAAAVAVVIVVAGSVAVGYWLASAGNSPSGNLRALRLGASAGSYAGVPAYYVAVENPSLAVVAATATGTTLASIRTRTPFVGVTGAADDRTFVLDAQSQAVGAGVQWLGQPTFYLLRLSASGSEESFTQLAIAALPTGTAVTGLALSPDGSKLAVEVDSGSFTQPGLLEIRVYTLATGAFRSWLTDGSADPVDPSGFTGSGVDGSETISWAADSTTLAFDWLNQSDVGVRLLDTAAPGNNLIADSRLAVMQADLTPRASHLAPSRPAPPNYVSECVTDSIISPDGSAVVCGYTTTVEQSSGAFDTTTGFMRYPTSTSGSPLVLGVFQFAGEAAGDISLYWTDSAGNILIGGILTPSGVRVGVINGDTFTPLPGITGLGAAAW
jgi:hypothetical protein